MWVRRSRSAVVILGSPKTVAHLPAQVRGDDDAGAFVKFAEQMEEQRTARCTEAGQVPHPGSRDPGGRGFGKLSSFAFGLPPSVLTSLDGRQKRTLRW
jgi:hypothetical protein